MESFDVKSIMEYGFLGAINVILLWKGIPALNELTKSNTALAETVSKLTEQVNSLKISFEYQIRELNNRLEKLENKSEKNFNELKDLITLYGKKKGGNEK